MAYATVDDLAAWIADPVPADAARMLDRASELVAEQIQFAVYATNSTGDPTDTTVLTALRDATCAQVEHWLTAGDEADDIDDVQPTSISVGPLALNWGNQRGNDAPAASPLAPRARRILGNAGLLDVHVSTEPVVLW